MSDYEYDEPGDGRFGGRTWTLVAAVAVVVALVGVGGWLVITGDDDDSPGANENPETPNNGPSSDEFVGPRQITGGMPTGFAHTPEGSQAAAASWMSYAALLPTSRMPEGVLSVFESPDVLGLDPQLEGWLSATPIGVSDGVEADSGVVKVLIVKHQVDEETDDIVVGLFSVAVSLVWSDEAEDWRATQVEIVKEFAPPLSRSDFTEYEWLAPISMTAAGPLVSDL